MFTVIPRYVDFFKKKQKKYEHEKAVRDAVVIDASCTPQGQARDDDELTCIVSSQPHVLGLIDKWTCTIDPKLSGEARLKQMKINKAAWEERSLRAHEYIARWVCTHGKILLPYFFQLNCRLFAALLW